MSTSRFYFTCLFAKITQLRREVVLSDLSALGKIRENAEASISKNKCIATGKLEMKKPFRFSLFFLFEFSGQSDRKFKMISEI